MKIIVDSLPYYRSDCPFEDNCYCDKNDVIVIRTTVLGIRMNIKWVAKITHMNAIG